MTDYLFILAGGFFVAVIAGMAFTFGAAMACRVLKWAPVNITVNNYIKEDDHARTKR